jgi:hypothetical protein
LLTPINPDPQQVEIGKTVVSSAQIEKIEEAIETNPVENFDLARVVNIFSTYLQFFELEVVGTHVERSTPSLASITMATASATSRLRALINADATGSDTPGAAYRARLRAPMIIVARCSAESVVKVRCRSIRSRNGFHSASRPCAAAAQSGS